MKRIRLELDHLEVRSFPTTLGIATGHEHVEAGAMMATQLSACSETNGAFACKSCGPCCQ